MVTIDLSQIKQIQKEMLKLQNRNWKTIQDQFAEFEHNCHILPDCDQLLYPKQQISFNYDTVSSLLTFIFENVNCTEFRFKLTCLT